MDALVVGIKRGRVNFILDADIEKFFDRVSHEWLNRFVEHRVGDKRVLRLIQKWLKTGVIEQGVEIGSDRGTAQGSAISPLLAPGECFAFPSVYLHYVFDLWADPRIKSGGWRRREAEGNVILVRYADDIIVGFERQSDALRFLDDMRARLEKFALNLHPAKTRLIEFGRHAPANRERRGAGKASTSSAGYVRLSGLYLHLRKIAQRVLPDQTEAPRRPHAGQTRKDRRRTASTHASPDRQTGRVAEADRRGVG